MSTFPQGPHAGQPAPREQFRELQARPERARGMIGRLWPDVCLFARGWPHPWRWGEDASVEERLKYRERQGR
jgi:hypothetical protein